MDSKIKHITVGNEILDKLKNEISIVNKMVEITNLLNSKLDIEDKRQLNELFNLYNSLSSSVKTKELVLFKVLYHEKRNIKNRKVFTAKRY